MITAPDPALYRTILALFVVLVAGSIVRFIALRNADESKRRQRFASLRSWWMLAVAISAAMLTGRVGICLFLAVISCIAWFELTKMIGARKEDRTAILAGYGLIVANYLLILFGLVMPVQVFLPVAAGLLIAILLLIKGEPRGYIRSAGSLLWGMLFLGYGISHAGLLTSHPAFASGPLGPAGWFLFLVILTETDDIFQAVIGRRFGAHKRHRISPTISPNKTIEGFFGGLLVVVILAPLIAPLLTTLGQEAGPFGSPEALRPVVAPMIIAVLISVAGFFGDINMSAIKRDAGVKDSGRLLPGIGGAIDRIDSLTMTAPVYFYFVIWWTA